MSCADFVTIVEGKALRAAPGELRLGLLGMPSRVSTAMSWRSRFVSARSVFTPCSASTSVVFALVDATLGFSHRKLVRTGIPQFMAARALAVTGGSFRDALKFVHDNVDQPAEFWQPESEREESRPPSVESQLLCSRMQSVPSSEGLGTADAAAGRAAEAARTDVLGFEDLCVGDCVLIDVAASDEAVSQRLKKHDFDVAELPRTIQLPKWRSYDRDTRSSPFHGIHLHGIHPPWYNPSLARHTSEGSGRRAQWTLTLGTVEVECTVLNAQRGPTVGRLQHTSWEDSVDESMDFRVSVLHAPDLFPSGDTAVPLSCAALERLARTAPSAVVLPFESVQRVRARQAVKQLQAALSAASDSIRAILLECDDADAATWLNSQAREPGGEQRAPPAAAALLRGWATDTLSQQMVVLFHTPGAERTSGNVGLGPQVRLPHGCETDPRHGWEEGSTARLAVATEPYTLAQRPFGARPMCTACGGGITGPCAFKKSLAERAGASLLAFQCLDAKPLQTAFEAAMPAAVIVVHNFRMLQSRIRHLMH